MFNKSGAKDKQHHLSIPELIKKEKTDAEKKRQTEYIKNTLIPWLKTETKSISDARELLGGTEKFMGELFNTMLQEEQVKVSQTLITSTDLEKRAQEDLQNSRKARLITLLNGEKIATAVGILMGMRGLIEASEYIENGKRKLETLSMEI